MISEDAWTDAIQPTLADANGDAILISTPAGRNWYWREWLRGQDPLATDYASWTAPSSANPNPQIRRAARLAKDRVPEVKYRQEWLAEFIDDGSLFRRVREAATATPQREALPGHAYVMGVDLARRVDFTVCVVIDHSLSPPAAVCMDRFTQTDWQTQVSRITALAQRFGVQAMLVDQTGLGDPVVEQLQREPTMPRGTAVLGYQLTNASKATIIESLALAFERGEIALIADPVLLGELLAYESERLPSGLVRYHAPDNQHDDAVIATALGYWAAVYGRVTVAPPLYA